MKNLLFVCILCLTGSMSLHAQLSFGLKAGVNFSWVGEISENNNYSSEDVNEMLIGGAGGVFVQSSRQRPVGFRAELLYSMKGEKDEVQLSSNTFENLNLNYLTLPLSFIYTPASFLDLEAGVEPALVVSKNPEFVELDSELDVGLFLGAIVPVGDKLSLGLRFTLGMLNFYEVTYLDGNELDTIFTRNRSGQLWLAYSF
ncbi:MAG: PorT family protein [Bacteroidetes bacterium]|nr:PorT family protein [Bacteroidota bacterium]